MSDTARSREKTAFKVLAVIGQHASLFPFAAAYEAFGAGRFSAPEFLAIYAVWAAFWACGLFADRLAERVVIRQGFPKRLVPVITFLSRMLFLLPSAGFIAAGAALDIPGAAYFYILAAAVAVYFGGNTSVGRSYSAVFSMGWFALYLVMGTYTAAALGMSDNSELASKGRFMLRAGFAVVILLFALLKNQSNIDSCTDRRDRGRAVLPRGLRRYNAALGGGIFAAALCLFVFAKPLGQLINAFLRVLLGLFLSVLSLLSGCAPDGERVKPVESVDTIDHLPDGVIGGDQGDIVAVLAVLFLLVMAVLCRKPLLNAIKTLLAPLIKRGSENDVPFADEITESAEKRGLPPRARRKAERGLMRRYARETSSKRKYRLGYALYLMRLSRTDKPPKRSDTTSELREKGERAFNEELGSFTETYNKVRYGEQTPTAKDLAAERELLKRIR